MSAEEKIKELDIKLPDPKDPVGSYLAIKLSGKLLYISGQISGDENGRINGKLGENFSVEEGQIAAKTCGINLIAQLKSACDGDLGRLVQVVKLGGFVNCTSDFEDHPKVINGASDLMVAVFGEAGKHARAAVGSSSLPLGVAVEVEGIFQIK